MGRGAARRFLSDEAQCAEGLADAIGIDHAVVGAMSSARGADLAGWNIDEIYQKAGYDRGKMPSSPSGGIICGDEVWDCRHISRPVAYAV